MSHSRILAIEDQGEQLDSEQLDLLEQSFRNWVSKGGPGRSLSRTRILMIFLLIRYTGAKLNEVLGLRADKDIFLEEGTIVFRAGGSDGSDESREVHISEKLSEELAELMARVRDLVKKRHFDADDGVQDGDTLFAVDPAFVRRKFYDRAQDCGFNPKQGGPEMIRKARSLELMRNNMPLPVVQRLLGHSTPNLTASHVSFSEEDMRHVTRWFMERESKRKTSARNSFFGKVANIWQEDVQSLVELATTDGGSIFTIITNSSAVKLGLKKGTLASAEIKAPWLTLESVGRGGQSSADNVREGVISRISEGTVNVECEVDIGSGLSLCAIVSTPGFQSLGLGCGDKVRVLFNCYSVILHAD